jgi:SAM-dependent methyltransferase
MGGDRMGGDRVGRFASPAGMKAWVRGCEDWWFDTTRRVGTTGKAGIPDASEVVGKIRDSHIYAPVRVANARAALGDLPVEDHGRYTFVDVGSGKGRMLFVAAEYPFRKVVGVEYSVGLQEQAVANIRRWRRKWQRCSDIESVLADAASFKFPDGNLVLYLFNPFGPEVMKRMVENLERTMERDPRHVVVVMQWPEYPEVVAGMRGMQVYRETRRYHIYQAGS